jgi:group II intron reverse transcriptase/maturase
VPVSRLTGLGVPDRSAPMPERTPSFPKPSRILSKKALREAWRQSRDSTRNAGRPGIDHVTAEQFSAKLDSNLEEICLRLRKGNYGFSGLRAVFVPKPNSDKERLICVPTIKDRIVQRAICDYLNSRSSFPIYNASSYGFIAGRGTREAVSSVVKLRSKYDWCLKTDIESFFDRIPRGYLKEQVVRHLRRCSLTPLIYKVIDCEAQQTEKNRQRLKRQNISRGIGVRQGMPLSPMLSNLALADFDRKIEKREIEMVRYADDITLFFGSKNAAKDGMKIVSELLYEIQLTIPKISDDSKTKIISSSEPLEFLGREILFSGSENKFVARISKKQIEKIKTRLTEDYSLEKLIQEKDSFQDAILKMSRSVAAYLGIYKDAFNFATFEDDLRGCSRAIIASLFENLFGPQAIQSLTPEKRKFLGINSIDIVEPNSELDV